MFRSTCGEVLGGCSARRMRPTDGAERRWRRAAVRHQPGVGAPQTAANPVASSVPRPLGGHPGRAGQGDRRRGESARFSGLHLLILDPLTSQRLPSIYQWPQGAEDGWLIAYGPPSGWGSTGSVVDRLRSSCEAPKWRTYPWNSRLNSFSLSALRRPKHLV